MSTIGRRSLGKRSAPRPLVRAAKTGVRGIMAPTAVLRAFPDVLVVGAQRCGTTSLYRYLVEHPDVLGPPLNKGVHYFDIAYERGDTWYRSHFPTRISARGKKVVEGSPYYLFHPRAASRIARTLPDVKILVVLREPGDRALSQHQHESARGFETLPFAEALEAEAGRLAGEEERLLADDGHRSMPHQHWSYMARGRYAEQLHRYFDEIGRERVLVLSNSELSRSPAETMERVFGFLGLSPVPGSDYPRFNARRYDDMDPAVRRRLDAYFAPFNADLRGLLGVEEDPW